MSMKKIVLFAGTTEGHRLCECFVQNKWQAEVFVATEYGREILPQAPNLHIHAGRLDMKQIYSQLTQIRDRKSTRLNSSHSTSPRMPSSA